MVSFRDYNNGMTQKDKIDLAMPVQYLKGVGPARAAVFEQLGVKTVGDLLEYFPRDWNFFATPIKIKDVQPNEIVSVIGQVESTDFQNFRRPPIFEIMLADDTDVCRVIWFNGSYLTKQIKVGQVIMVSGKAAVYKHNLQITNPKFVVIEQEDFNAEEYFGGGVYPATAKLTSRRIKQVIKPVLDNIDVLIDEFYDKNFLKDTLLVGRKDAFRWIHLPPDEEKLAQAKRRLKYDELFLMQTRRASAI